MVMKRFEVIDFLRGFAIFTIIFFLVLIIHYSVLYLFPVDNYDDTCSSNGTHGGYGMGRWLLDTLQ